MGLIDFARGIKTGNYIPKDAYSHASYMISADEQTDNYDFDKSEFRKLINKHVLLANVNDDRMLRLYQNDVICLTSLFDMALREPRLQELFLELYFGWRAELSLTRIKDGKERTQQAEVNGRVQNQYTGYGEYIMDERQREEEEKNFLKNLLNKGKK